MNKLELSDQIDDIVSEMKENRYELIREFVQTKLKPFCQEHGLAFFTDSRGWWFQKDGRLLFDDAIYELSPEIYNFLDTRTVPDTETTTLGMLISDQ